MFLNILINDKCNGKWYFPLKCDYYSKLFNIYQTAEPCKTATSCLVKLGGLVPTFRVHETSWNSDGEIVPHHLASYLGLIIQKRAGNIWQLKGVTTWKSSCWFMAGISFSGQVTGVNCIVPARGYNEHQSRIGW